MGMGRTLTERWQDGLWVGAGPCLYVHTKKVAWFYVNSLRSIVINNIPCYCGLLTMVYITAANKCLHSIQNFPSFIHEAVSILLMGYESCGCELRVSSIIVT